MSREVVNFTIARFGRVAPEDLLGKSCGHHLSAALIYSPEACQVARIDGAGFTVVDRDSETERPADLSSAYEIRAFGKKAELRWLPEGKTGTATLLADGSVEGQPDSTDTGTTIDVLPRTYRVWGEPPKARDGVPPRPIAGWTKLTAGRIGALFVPETPGGPGEVVLRAREYVVRHDTGNAVVLFERLVEFDQAQE